MFSFSFFLSFSFFPYFQFNFLYLFLLFLFFLFIFVKKATNNCFCYMRAYTKYITAYIALYYRITTLKNKPYTTVQLTKWKALQECISLDEFRLTFKMYQYKAWLPSIFVCSSTTVHKLCIYNYNSDA